MTESHICLQGEADSIMKRLISLFLCFVLITGVLSSCGQSKRNDRSNGSGIKVMLTLSQADTFRNTLVEAAQKAAYNLMSSRQKVLLKIRLSR